MSFNISSKLGEINIDNFADTIDEWIIKKSEVFEYSKETEIVKSFKETFGHIAILGSTDSEKFDYITKLVSRSESLSVWFAFEKIKYSQLSQLPSYLKDLVSPSEFIVSQKRISSVNDTVSSYVNKKLNITNKYKAELSKIDEEAAIAIKKVIGDDKIVKILTLTSQSLPLTLINAIESYNSKTDDSNFEEKKSLYGREMLVKFKVALLTLIKNNEKIDIDELIKDLSLK